MRRYICRFRHPGTTNERRQFEEEVHSLVRAKRRPKKLPDVYDDAYAGSLFDRSWKRFRKQRWRGDWER